MHFRSRERNDHTVDVHSRERCLEYVIASMSSCVAPAGVWTFLEFGFFTRAEIRAGSASVFFKSVSVFGFVVGFSKVGSGFGIGFSKYRDIGFGFLFFRTNLPLLIE